MKLEILDSPDANGVQHVRSTIEDSPDGTFVGGGPNPKEGLHHARFYQQGLAMDRGQYSRVGGEFILSGTLPPSYEVLPYMLEKFRPQKLIRRAN